MRGRPAGPGARARPAPECAAPPGFRQILVSWGPVPKASVFSDRAFLRRPRPDPAPEDLRIPDRAMPLLKKNARPRRQGQPRAGSVPSVLFPEPHGVLDQRLPLGPVHRDAGRLARRHLTDPLARADVVVDAKALEQRPIVFLHAAQKVAHRPVEPLRLVDVPAGVHVAVVVRLLR